MGRCGSTSRRLSIGASLGLMMSAFACERSRPLDEVAAQTVATGEAWGTVSAAAQLTVLGGAAQILDDPVATDRDSLELVQWTLVNQSERATDDIVLRASCGCLSLQPDGPFRLAPGGRVVVSATLGIRQEGPFRHTVAVVRQEAPPIMLEVTGVGRYATGLRLDRLEVSADCSECAVLRLDHRAGAAPPRELQLEGENEDLGVIQIDWSKAGSSGGVDRHYALLTAPEGGWTPGRRYCLHIDGARACFSVVP